MDLTLKQRIFIKNYLKNGNATEAAVVAYKVKNRNVAGVIASENLRKPNIVNAIIRSLDKCGLSDNYLAIGLRQIIESGTGIKANAETTTKGIELAFKLHKYL